MYEECFCENNEDLKGVIYSQKSSIIDVWQGSNYASGLNFKNFSIQLTLHQGRRWIKLLSTSNW